MLLPTLIEVVGECSQAAQAPALRFQAAMLRRSLEDLLSTIAEEFVGTPADLPDEALAAYRRDHLWAIG